MIQMQSRLKVADNSGAIQVQCIKVLGGSKKNVAGVGEQIIVSVKKAYPNSKIKKGQVCKAVIVRTKFPIMRSDGSSVKFDNNAVVLLNQQGDLIATRIFGPVTRELKNMQLMKIISLAPEVL